MDVFGMQEETGGDSANHFTARLQTQSWGRKALVFTGYNEQYNP